MDIIQVPYLSPLYEASKRLRDEVLRKPLGLELGAKDVEGEEVQVHIAALENGGVIGCVILKPLSATVVKLRHMAVATNQQGKGLGRDIMLAAEKQAKARNFDAIELNARIYAQDFYKKLGYEATGDIFMEVTLPHIKMYKRI